MINDLERANESGHLWPPIADALDTYLRRRTTGAEGYELTWRLIHVWEATVTTLAGAATSWLRETGRHPDVYLKCREHYHGVRLNPGDGSIERRTGALEGSASERLNVLQAVATMPEPQVPAVDYGAAVRTFLNSREIDLRDLTSAWQRVCKVPQDALNADKYTVMEAMRHVNSFRNKLAHVPFPHDVMTDVASALEDVSASLFAIAPPPHHIHKDGQTNNSALIGAILYGSRGLRGTGSFLSALERPEATLMHPPIAKPNRAPETWSAQPFFFVDSMLRVHVLAQAKPKDGKLLEYVRFRAEANALQIVATEDWQALLPVPTKSDYASATSKTEGDLALGVVASAPVTTSGAAGASNVSTIEQSSSSVSEEEARHIAAVVAIQNEDYEPAIAYFKDLVARQPTYHIGWLRLGYAARELANRIRNSEPKRAEGLYETAVAALDKATAHIDAGRQAQALYELSKAYYHWSTLSENEEHAQQALVSATTANERAPEGRYQDWIEYLRQREQLRLRPKRHVNLDSVRRLAQGGT